jgi:hypothetical protein
MPVSTAEELLAAAPEGRSRLVEQALAERWDQVRARDALRSAQPPRLTNEALLDPDDIAEMLSASHQIQIKSAVERNQAGNARLSVRPRGFTRAIREFHRLIAALKADDLTPSDRAALRSLFRDLLFLARSAATPTKPVFPPLPTSAPRAAPRSRSKMSRSR